MNTETAYIPQKEDFVLAPPELTRSAVKESIGGVKHEALRRFFANKSSVLGVIIIALLVIMSIVGPYISGHSYDEQELARANLPPRIPVLSSVGIADGSESVPMSSGHVSVNK